MSDSNVDSEIDIVDVKVEVVDEVEFQNYISELNENSNNKFYTMPILPAHNCINCTSSFTTKNSLEIHSVVCNSKIKQESESENSNGESNLKSNELIKCPDSSKKLNKTDRGEQFLTVDVDYFEEKTHELSKDLKKKRTRKLFSCDKCNRLFTRKTALTNHKKIHNYIPGKALMAQAGASISHVSKRTDYSNESVTFIQNKYNDSVDIMYTCNKCDYQFYSKNSLEYHKMEHDSLDYKIEDNQSTNLNSDRDSKNSQTDDKVQELNIKKKKKYKKNIVSINRDPNCDKSYICKTCSTGFTRKSALTSHEAIHQMITDDKAYKLY